MAQIGHLWWVVDGWWTMHPQKKIDRNFLLAKQPKGCIFAVFEIVI
jgi:hypothetical protein